MKDAKTINASIAAIKSAGVKLDSKIQSTAVDVLEHFMQYRDTAMVNRLYMAMPKGSRRMALADWLLKFVAVLPNTDQKTKAEQPFVFANKKVDAMMAESNLVLATSTHWYDLKKEKTVDEVFDVRAKVMALIRSIEKSTKLDHYDVAAEKALGALAVAVGIPASDVPHKAGSIAAVAGAEDATV